MEDDDPFPPEVAAIVNQQSLFWTAENTLRLRTQFGTTLEVFEIMQATGCPFHWLDVQTVMH